MPALCNFLDGKFPNANNTGAIFKNSEDSRCAGAFFPKRSVDSSKFALFSENASDARALLHQNTFEK
jgi:hypothetical protein